MDDDSSFLAEALRLGSAALGGTWPNPAVGCLLVDPETQRVVGRGATAPGGRPHAEPQAIRAAGEAAKGATAYVTLEPCSHWGNTPPCSEALAEAGVARVVFPIRDPDPRVSGGGAASMRSLGIAVDEGPMSEAAREANLGFLTRICEGRPVVLPSAEGVGSRPESLEREARQAPYGAADACLGSVGYWGPPAGFAGTGLPWRFLEPRDDLAAGLAALGREGLNRLITANDDPLTAALLDQGLLVPPRHGLKERATHRPKVKVCGFTRESDLDGALGLGVDAVGIVLSDGPCRVEAPRAKELLDFVRRRGTSTVTVAIAGPMELGYAEVARDLGFDLVQVVDPPLDWLAERPWALPVLFDGEGQREKAERFAREAADFHRFAVCPGFPPLFTIDGPRGGGLGVAANWRRAARLSARWPLTLAGGLNAQNVADAIARVQPVALDLSSGVETASGVKSPAKIQQFLEACTGPAPQQLRAER